MEPTASHPSGNEHAPRILHDPDHHCFEMLEDGSPRAYLTYSPRSNHVVFDHTYVPDELRGRGIAGELTRRALQEARLQNWKVLPACSYVAVFIERNPEFKDLLYQPT